MPTKIEAFIAHARTKNMDHQTIRMLLLSSGWKEKDIASALASGTLDLPVPVPPDTGSAKDAFFHLLTFTTLYATVISLIVLAFDYIGRLFPDAAMYNYQYADATNFSTIRWSIAVIVVSYPIFALLSRQLHREFKEEPEKLASGVRKWLTYLTLFVTACTILGDVVTLLFYLLNGELSVRFALKVASVFLLSGIPFMYYFHALRMDSDHYTESTMHKKYLWVSAAITGLFIVYGIFVAGTPVQGRSERFDEQRINDLRSIQNEVLNQVFGVSRAMPLDQSKVLPKPLPVSLEEIVANAQYEKVRIIDPETSKPYGYSVSGSVFELCANFTLERDQSYDVFWNHPAGEHCFRSDALDQMWR